MVTTQSIGLVVVSIAILILTVATGQIVASLTSLSLLFWFGVQWVLFERQVSLAARTLRLHRRFGDHREGHGTLLAGRSTDVHVVLESDSPWNWTWIELNDHPPRRGVATGTTSIQGPCHATQSLSLRYRFECATTGRVRFEGASVTFSDPQGFFRRDWFVRQPIDILVLPGVIGELDRASVTKRLHHLPGLGIHRYRAPGSGGELLELRDYQPGDSPRTIAWKVSARRDRLMTKSFESLVPIQTTLFIDHSDDVRWGGGSASALDQFVGIASVLARELLSSGDPVGLCLVAPGLSATSVIDSRREEWIKPAPGRRQLLRLATRLARTAAEPPDASFEPLENLIDHAWPLAQRVYPDLLRPRGNDNGPLYRRLPAALRIRGIQWSFLLGALGAYAAFFQQDRWYAIPLAIACVVILTFLLIRGRLREKEPAMDQGDRRTRRRQLAGLIALLRRFPAGMDGILAEDRPRLAAHLAELLREHQIWVEPSGRPTPTRSDLSTTRKEEIASTPLHKIDVAARALSRALTHGRDNELFVLMIDLLECASRLGPLRRAVRAALSRHHHVLIICPWPAGLAAPDELNGAADPPSLSSDPLEEHDRRRFRNAYARLRDDLASAGAKIVIARVDAAVPVVLREIDRLRVARTRVRNPMTRSTSRQWLSGGRISGETNSGS